MIDEGWWPVLEIPDSKLVDYLPNPEHLTGGPKARFFLSFGFDRSRPQELGRALLAQADALYGTEALCLVQVDGRVRLVVEGPIAAPEWTAPARPRRLAATSGDRLAPHHRGAADALMPSPIDPTKRRPRSRQPLR